MKLTHDSTGIIWSITLVECEGYTRDNPTWIEVRAALQSMDAGRRSELVVEAADGSLLVVGGGNGRFHIQITYPRGTIPEILLLVDPSRGTGPEELIVGGVKTALPSQFIVDEAKALQAASRFFENGSADQGLIWEVG